jgi:hypothetical protein
MKCPDVSDEIKEKMEKKDLKFNGIIILDPPTGEALGLSDEVLVTLNDIKFGPLPEHGFFLTSPESEIILSIKVVNANEEGTSVDQKTNLGEIKYVADYDKLNIHHQVIFQGKLNSPALQFEINILEADVENSKKVKEVVSKSLAAVATVPGIPYKDMVLALPDLVNSVIALNADDQVLNYKFSLFTKPIVVEEDEFKLREGTYTIRKVWDNTERDVYSVCLEINVMKILQNER